MLPILGYSDWKKIYFLISVANFKIILGLKDSKMFFKLCKKDIFVFAKEEYTGFSFL